MSQPLNPSKLSHGAKRQPRDRQIPRSKSVAGLCETSSRRAFLRLGLAGSVFAGGGATRAASPGKPNIVLLYADDLGWTDLGCFGSKYYETPNLDRLCRQGMKFTASYSCAGNCAPSRACLLTGQYVPRHGVYTVGGKNRFDNLKDRPKWSERRLLAPENASGLAYENVTMAEALGRAGYTCGLFGKWHIAWGRDQDRQRPEDHGFDEAVTQAAPRHFDFRVRPNPSKSLPKDAYLSDYLAEQAIQFIDTNRDRPFFLCLSDYLVHVPLEAKPRLVEKYRNKPPVDGHHNPVYAAMIESLDQNCGRILDKLDELSLADNTLVVFVSDNGGVGSAANRGLNRGGPITSNYPLRGMKGMLYEGGIRTPMMARWPGVVQPGSVCDEPVIGVDFYPTFLDVARHRPGDHILDGESLLPLLKGETSELSRTDIFWFMPGYLPGRQAPAAVIRSGDYKLIESFEDGTVELFNLRQDIGERNNLASTEPERARDLRMRLTTWRESIGARTPQRNPSFKPQ